MDEDWHAISQDIYKGLCEEWRKPAKNHKANALWMLRDAMTNGEAHCEIGQQRWKRPCAESAESSTATGREA